MLLPQAVERLGGVAESLVRQQLTHEVEPRVGAVEARERFRRIAGVLAFLARRQRLRLDLDQRRGEDEELTRRLHVDPVQLPEMVEVLLGDRVDRDVVDVDFRPTDQKEQEVERPLELLEPDEVLAGVGGTGAAPAVARSGIGRHGRSVGHAGRLSGGGAPDRRFAGERR